MRSILSSAISARISSGCFVEVQAREEELSAASRASEAVLAVQHLDLTKSWLAEVLAEWRLEARSAHSHRGRHAMA